MKKHSFILTQAALKQATLFQENNPGPLRLYLAGKGCDGFDYGVCFSEKEPDDYLEMHDSIELICDPSTLDLTKGSTIDWVDDERGQGFLIENPRHHLFKGKFYKKAEWRERAERFYQTKM